MVLSTYLLKIVTQTVAPIVAYAETDLDEPVEQVDEEVTPTLVTANKELLELINELAVIEDVEITSVEEVEDVFVYSALNESDEKFFIVDINGSLSLEVGEIYASITGTVSEQEGVYFLVTESEEDVVVAELPDSELVDEDENTEVEGESEIEEEEPALPTPAPGNGGSTDGTDGSGGTGSTAGTPGAQGSTTTPPTSTGGRTQQKDLPAAGTNMESTLYAGLTIIFAGGVLFVISKRKERKKVS